VSIRTTPLAPVFDPLASDFVFAHYEIASGDLDEGFAAADLILEGEYRVVPNGIDCSRFNPHHAQLETVRTPEKATILFVGRLESRKGLPTLIEAYGQLRRAREEAISRLTTRDGTPLWNTDEHSRAEISQQSQDS